MNCSKRSVDFGYLPLVGVLDGEVLAHVNDVGHAHSDAQDAPVVAGRPRRGHYDTR